MKVVFSTFFLYTIFVMKKFFSRYLWWQWIIIVLALAINVFIIINSFMNANQSTKQSGSVVELLTNIINGIKPGTINDENISSFSNVIRKLIGHFGLFLISGIFTTLSVKFIYYNLKKKYWIFVIISSSFGLFLAILTEFIQLFVPGRSGEMMDVLIDFLGYIIAALIICLIIYILRLKTPTEENVVE